MNGHICIYMKSKEMPKKNSFQQKAESTCEVSCQLYLSLNVYLKYACLSVNFSHNIVIGSMLVKTECNLLLEVKKMVTREIS